MWRLMSYVENPIYNKIRYLCQELDHRTSNSGSKFVGLLGCDFTGNGGQAAGWLDPGRIPLYDYRPLTGQE